MVDQLLKLLVDFRQVDQIKLHTAVQFGTTFCKIASLPLITFLHLTLTSSTSHTRHALDAAFASLLLVVVLLHLLISFLVEDFLLLVRKIHDQVLVRHRYWTLHKRL